jgi:hypothetical protein
MKQPMSSGVGHARVAVLQATFLLILPRIELHGRVYFRYKRADKREEMVAEMVGLCWRWFVRLVQRGKDPTAFASALAGYAARAVNSGRRVCGMDRAKDVLSPRAQRRHGFTVSKLPDRSTLSDNPLSEALHDSTKSSPPDAAAFRCDFPAWLGTHAERDRRIAADLMVGERTQDVARRFGLSPGRVSQKRRDFHTDWQRFHGELNSSAV